MKNALFRGRDFLLHPQNNILSAAFVIAAAVFLSRFLGLVRLRLLTDRFPVADIGLFLAAFRLPNMIFDLVVMGALTTAFIPVFTSFLARNRKEEADKLASVIINLSTAGALFLAVIFLVFTHPLVNLIASGLSETEINLVVPFTRLMLIGQVFPLLLGNFLTGLLQAHKRFFLPALAPVAYNVGIILGIIFLSPFLGLYGAVWGVVLGAVFFLLVQLPAFLHLSFRYSPIINFSHPGVKQVGRLIAPRVLGLFAGQINATVALALSSLFSARGITIFAFAQALAQLPIGVFAQPVSQAALPTLSEDQAKDATLAIFKKTFLACLHQILFLAVPAAVILAVLRIPIVRLVYGASQFDWPATVETGRILIFFSIGLVAEAVGILLVRSFYALSDSKTPVTINIAAVFLNILLAVFFTQVWHWPIWNLALAMSISDILAAALLLIFLAKKTGGFAAGDFFIPALKIGLAAVVAGVSLRVLLKLLDQLVFDTTRTVPLLMLTGTAGTIGLSVYLFLAWALAINEAKALFSLFLRAKKKVLPAYEPIANP